MKRVLFIVVCLVMVSIVSGQEPETKDLEKISKTKFESAFSRFLDAANSMYKDIETGEDIEINLSSYKKWDLGFPAAEITGYKYSWWEDWLGGTIEKHQTFVDYGTGDRSEMLERFNEIKSLLSSLKPKYLTGKGWTLNESEGKAPGDIGKVIYYTLQNKSKDAKVSTIELRYFDAGFKNSGADVSLSFISKFED